MAETAESQHDTPSDHESNAEGQGGELKAAKDRNCPFCGQAFTSSSLGRHLDLYIKPKNPKPPDGVHDVEEIKKLRGSITRRQPRSSLKAEPNKKEEQHKKNSGGTPSSTSKKNVEDSKVPIGSLVTDSRDVNDGKLHTYINAANWQATGVINDLPARAASRYPERPASGQAQRAYNMRHDTAGNRIQRPEYVGTDDIQKLQESAEVGRAAEMALREVLGSLEAAKRRAEPRKLFDEFDFCSLAFPGLCLAILPPPPTLFTSTPFPVAHTWSLSPPGETQRATLVRLLHERVATVRNGNPDNVAESEIFRHRVHLDGAFEHWQNLSESERITAWNIEVCRAFVQEREKKQHLQDQLEVAEQRNRHLEAEYDRLSRCQLPREYLLHPPNTVPMPPSTVREMKTTDIRSGAVQVDYDAEALLNKWRTEVKAVARPLKPPPLQPQYVEKSRNEIKGDFILNGSVFGVNGPMPRDSENMTRMNNPQEAIQVARNLGGIVGSDEDDDAEVEDVILGDSVDGEIEDESKQRALTKRRSVRQMGYEDSGDSPINAHGKRPLGPSNVNGRSPGPKMYKEQPK